MPNIGFWAVAGAGGGAAPSAYEQIATTTLSSMSGTITFSSIPQDYRHLQVRVVTAMAAGGQDFLVLRPNGDTGNTYARHRLQGNGTSVTSSAGTAISGAWIGATCGSSTQFSATIADVLDYTSTTKNKTIRGFSGGHGDNPIIGLFSGVWLSTAAVTSLTIRVNSGSNLAANSRFSLYGIKG